MINPEYNDNPGPLGRFGGALVALKLKSCLPRSALKSLLHFVYDKFIYFQSIANLYSQKKTTTNNNQQQPTTNNKKRRRRKKKGRKGEEEREKNKK